MEIDYWMPTKSAAKMLGISPTQLSYLARTGCVKRDFPDAGRLFATAYYFRQDIIDIVRASARVRRRTGRWHLPVLAEEEEEWLSVKEAAALLDVKPGAVHTMLRRGLLHSRLKPGTGKRRKYRLLLEEVEALKYSVDRLANRLLWEKRRWRLRLRASQSEPRSTEGGTFAEWLTAKEAADYLEIAPMTVYAYRVSGRLRARRVAIVRKGGPQWLFRRADVQVLLDDP